METNENARFNDNDLQTTFEIPLDEAITWVKAWADRGNFVKNFLIDASELQGIINEHGASYVRVYFAWDDTMEEGRKEKLVMTPTDEFGNDMIPKDGKPTSNVFDFTNPCPPTCSPDSPLNFPTGAGNGGN